MKAIQTFSKNTISVSKERCPNCKRKYLFKDGNEYCFHCDQIAKEDERVSKEVTSWIENRQFEETTKLFKDHSLLNSDLERATFNNYQPETESQSYALQEAKKYIDTFDGKSGLFFIGRPGVGKSHLSVSISKEALNRKITSIFISLPRLLTELKNTYNKNSQVSEKDLLKVIQNAELLVLDDVGAEKDENDAGTKWAKNKTFELLDSRLGKANVYTTNYDSRTLIKMYGERDFSRMVQNTKPIKIDGKNYRFKGF